MGSHPLIGCSHPSGAEYSTNSPTRAVSVPVLPKGGTVVFLGDSITWQHLYTAFIECYALRRYPKRALKFVNSGLPETPLGVPSSD